MIRRCDHGEGRAAGQRLFQIKAAAMLADDYTTSFSVGNGAKAGCRRSAATGSAGKSVGASRSERSSAASVPARSRSVTRPSLAAMRSIRSPLSADPSPELGPPETGNLPLVGCGRRQCGARKRLKHRRGRLGQELHG